MTNQNERWKGDKAEIAPISELHEMAQGYARDGIKIFPCVPDGKKPAIDGSFLMATTDLAQIDKWWTFCPQFNIALCPEDNGWCVIDVEAEGLRDWQMLCLEHPPFETFTNSTPGGGLHVYFTGSLPSTTKIQGLPIDTRGRGGYVLVPPSRVLVDKGPYKGQIRYYDTELQADVAPLPDWIAELFVVKPRKPSPATGAPVEREQLEARLKQLDPDCDRGTWRDIVAGIHATNVPDDEGGEYRPDLAHRWSSGELWRTGMSSKYDEADVDLVFYGMPPKEGGVSFGTIDHYARQAGFDGPSAAPRASMAETFAGVEIPRTSRLVSRRGSEVTPKKTEWIWPNRFPRGQLSLLAGNGGLGKSTVLLDLAARITRGAQWPDNSGTAKRGSVLYFSAEDSTDELCHGRKA